ncbi:Lipoprotein LipO [Paenibacillus solanacearum]|uniref:Lipoprotein LipO n=1 Tax=Paenibacillus solanacearum TaxID=2048548 RepID=A0A916NPN2_9BACL|nr:extracellular solute-binding protein [Paenibacillus solanacearum]CAG7616148.1 Lipoprotein LipO [Paenibacillus solanacearum]
MKAYKWLLPAALLLVIAGSVVLYVDRQAQRAAAGPEEPPLLLPEGLPILSKPVELTFLTGKSATSGSNWDEILQWKQYAAATNMNVHFQLVPFESMGEERKLALATGSYPDGFYAARLTAAELMKYGKDGVFFRLNDWIPRYAPNFHKLLERYPELRQSLTMPDGGIYSIPSFYDPEFLSMLIGTPLWLNGAWLEALKLPEPQTTGELYAYLKAVKERDPNGNGVADEIPFGSLGISMFVHQLKGAWGLGNRGLAHPLVDVDESTGQLRFIPVDPKYKEVLEYVHTLYAEGLIEKDIFTIGSSEFYTKGAHNLYGAMVTPSPYTQMKQPGYIGAPALQGPHSDRLYSHVKAPLVHIGAFAITNKNKYPEATLRWIDYFFGDEGSKLFYMGVKGVSYEEAPDGSLRYTERILNHKDGLTIEQALTPYVTWLGGSYPGFVRLPMFQGSESYPASIEAARKVKPYAVKEIWPPFPYSPGSLGTEIASYASQMQAKFVTGEVPFSDWDKYVGSMRMIGLDKYMTMYEQAYGAYLTSKRGE